jgi:endonuclease YncB( thermonuclease family)
MVAILTKREYPASFKRAIDGDTYELWFDYGFDSWQAHEVRLKGWDTPERGHPLYAKASALAAFAMTGKQLVVTTYKRESGTYDMSLTRYVADVLIQGQSTFGGEFGNIGWFLMDNKLALPWDGKGKHPWEGHLTWEEAWNAIK